MADRIVKILLTGSSESAVKAFEATAAASDKAQSKIEGSSSKLGAIMANPWVDAGLAVGTVAVSIIASTTAMASEYADATDKMASQAGISTKAASSIGTAFLGTAFDTTFSAQKLMEAYGPVAGQLATVEGHALTSAQALQVMKSASNLAEASGTDLSVATATLAGTMQAYGIKASGASQASDILFNSSRMLGMPVADVGNEVDKLKGKLGPLAPSLSDTAATMADLAEHGTTGRAAMTAMSGGFNTLLGGSKATNAELATMGVHVYDASGKFVGMQDVIAQLQPKLAGMTDAQKEVAEKTLFGATAAKSLDGVIAAGPAAYQKASDAVNQLGSAHKGAETATDNLSGAMDKAKAGIGDLGVQVGQIFLPIATALVEMFVQNVMPVLHTVFSAIEENMPTIKTVLGDVGAVIGGVFKAAWVILGTVIGIVIDIIKVAIGVIESIVGVVQGVVGGVTSAINFLKPVFSAVFGFIGDVVHAAFEAIAIPVRIWVGIVQFEIGLIVGIVQRVISTVVSIVQTVSGPIGAVFSSIARGIGAVFGGVAAVVRSAITAAIDVAKGVANTVIGVINVVIGGVDAIKIPAIGVGPVHTPAWNGLNLGKLPLLDTGGIVMGPSLAMLAMNSVPEVVAPLPDLKKALGMGAGSGAPVSITQNFTLSGGDAAFLQQVQTLITQNNHALVKAIQQRAA